MNEGTERKPGLVSFAEGIEYSFKHIVCYHSCVISQVANTHLVYENDLEGLALPNLIRNPDSRLSL